MIRLITAIYALFITTVVVSANNGWFPSAFVWARSIAGDKVLHFVLVGTMALLLNLLFNLRSIIANARWLQWGSVIMFSIATAEEFSQLLFARRSFDLLDLACNYAGIIVLGSLAFLIWRPKKPIA